MTITTQASNGVQVNSAAKDSTGSAAVLGSQTAAATDEIIVPDAITANNEGNLESSPTYVGRLVQLREAATGAATVTINSGGTGYAVDDVLTDNGAGATAARFARFIVTSVSSGVIDGIKIHEAGDNGTPAVTVGADRGEYSVEGTLTGRATTGGTGSSATLDLTFEDVEEVRYITADSSNTLTVHEVWTDGPASSENWRISYIIQDAATVTGLNLINKRVSDYSSSRRFQVTSGGYFAMLDGVSLETVDNSSTTVADFVVNNGAEFQNGYLASNTAVSGGYLIGTPAVAGEFVFDVDAGGIATLYDLFLTCVEQNKVNLNGSILLNKGKFFSASHSMDFTGSTGNLGSYTNLTIEGKSSTNDTITIDADTTINGVTLIATNGFLAGTAAETNEIRGAVILPNNLKFIQIADNASAIWDMVNPVWTLDVSDQTHLDFLGTADGTVNERFSLDVVVTETDGTPIQDARVKVYEGLDVFELPTVNDLDSAADGTVSSDVLSRIFIPNGASAITTTTKGLFALRVYDYGKTPFIGPLTLDQALDVAVALAVDTNITEASSATAITSGSGIVVSRQISLDYDAQTVDYTDGLVVTGGTSGATGTIINDADAGGSGTLVLKETDLRFVDNETVTDSGSGSATSDIQAGATVVPYKIFHYDGEPGLSRR